MSNNGDGKSVNIDVNKKIVTVDALDRTIKEVYDKLLGRMEELATKEELETKADTEFVNHMLNGLKLVQMTQSEYDALPEKDSSTLYIIV